MDFGYFFAHTSKRAIDSFHYIKTRPPPRSTIEDENFKAAFIAVLAAEINLATDLSYAWWTVVRAGIEALAQSSNDEPSRLLGLLVLLALLLVLILPTAVFLLGLMHIVGSLLHMVQLGREAGIEKVFGMRLDSKRWDLANAVVHDVISLTLP